MHVYLLDCPAGGREDADVRMLGEGRPFVMEIINPKGGVPSQEQLQAIERALVDADKWVWCFVAVML